MSKYQSYPEYKDSGVKWLGDIPSHWEAKRLGQFFEERREKVSDKDYPALSVTMKGIVPQLENAAKTDAGDNRKLVLKNDFVINSRSDRKGSSGTSPLDGSVSLISIVMKPKNINPAFAHHLLRSYPFQEEFYRFGKGIVADLWSTNSSEMKNILLPSMPFEESKRIAAFLDHETAKIDTLIEKQQQLIELLKEKRQAVISNAVTKGLNPDAPMKDSGVEWLGEVPEHWVVKSYRYACRIYRGKFGHRPRNDPAFYDGEYPFIQTGDVARAGKTITSYTQTLNEKGKAVSQLFPSGTLMMAIAANIGDTAILGFEAYAPDSVVGFKPYENLDLEFLRYSFMAALPALEQTSTQSTQANLNVDRIGAVKASFPSLREQEDIVRYLDNLLNQYDLIEKEAIQAIALMQERRTALISAAVTGKIDVRHWVAPTTSSDTNEAAQEVTA
ncbi:restriction endonuclease subunit S [Photobacterium leiognathi]|uniref:restriction endonuclease subunit S n=1 Tax=Photobacterium leiognathi TaxID=553611 RepID=UPI0029817C17|nr:restriction endonuclease subunit S [Photobacterium leiognathi]